MKHLLHLVSLRAAAVALCGLLLTGCASTAPKPTVFPSSAKDWNGIDTIEFVQDFRLENYSQIVVKPLDTSKTELPPKDENTYAPVVEVIKKADLLFMNQVVRGARKTAVKGGHPEGVGDLVVTGTVLEIHPGSQAARYWGGFGAGAAWVKINGEVADGKTGNVFFKFQQQRVGAMGAWGGSYDGLLSNCIEAIGGDVGRAIGAFKTK